ncbi:hypothetical protein BJV74DRAFT_862561 [Russula compacta]|nr:hypothetical protein BJV74DRAFT_862561 [Russula compacta]
MPLVLPISLRRLEERRHPPPAWKPAPERSHRLGLIHEATKNDWQRADAFCRTRLPTAPRLLASNVIDRIRQLGGAAWGLQYPGTARFIGRMERSDQNESGSGDGTWKVSTRKCCRDTRVMSDLPIMAGLYDIHDRRGVYYEVRINKMEGVVAIGTACKPYPSWRMPGWNRLSARLHLDDMRKFFEDPDGGRNYSSLLSRISPGDVVGCGYEFGVGALFFTYNGRRLPNAFVGIYMPRVNHDVYATIGLDGANEIDVNFGSSRFQWLEGNCVQWRVDGHVGHMVGSRPGQDERLPSYAEATKATSR